MKVQNKLAELYNGLVGHCKSSYLKDKPKELANVLKQYTSCYNDVTQILTFTEILVNICDFELAQRMSLDHTKINYFLVINSIFIPITYEQYQSLRPIVYGGHVL